VVEFGEAQAWFELEITGFEPFPNVPVIFERSSCVLFSKVLVTVCPIQITILTRAIHVSVIQS
jgi:hypothetical protein